MKTQSLIKTRSRGKEGCGLFNTFLNKLDREIHMPGGYNFLGPGTKLHLRLQRGDKPINPLDSAALEHDLAYTKFTDLPNRHIADKILENKAFQRVVAKDAKLSERSAALLTGVAMKVKRKLGMGVRRRRHRRQKQLKKIGKGFRRQKTKKAGNGLRRRTKKLGTGLRRRKTAGKGVSFNSLIKNARKAVSNKKSASLEEAANTALGVVQRALNKRKYKTPRVLPIPKRGGALPLIPILAGISALGGAASGVGSIVRAVKDIVEAKRTLFPGEKKQVGTGLYLAPYKKNGLGLYLSPYAKN